MSLADDLTAMIKADLPDLTNVFTDQEWTVRQPAYGVYVAQRQTGGTVEPLTRTETVFADISVRGQHHGEAGRLEAYDTILRIYKTFLLMFNRVINGTEYIRIYPDSSPFEVPNADSTCYDFQFGLELIRFIGE